jgi:hypothetical protein
MMRSIIANLTPALRRQDHTTSPSAIASFVHAKKHVTTLLRPPHPVPTFVTMANAPLFGTGRTAKATDLRARSTTTGCDRLARRANQQNRVKAYLLAY